MLEASEKQIKSNENNTLSTVREGGAEAVSEDIPVLEVELEPNYGLEARAIVDDAFMDAGRSSKGRVRFVAPVMMRSDKRIEASQGTILNLSVGGVACAAALDLHLNQNVWLRFRPEPDAEPGQFYCQVKWCHRPLEGNPIYGLEFVDLPKPEEKTFREVVSAGGHEEKLTQHLNFELDDELPRSALRSRSPRLVTTALLGMLVGVGTALVLALVPYTGLQAKDIWENLNPWSSGLMAEVGKVEQKRQVPKAILVSPELSEIQISTRGLDTNEGLSAEGKLVEPPEEVKVEPEQSKVEPEQPKDGHEVAQKVEKDEPKTNRIEPFSVPDAVRLDLGKAEESDAEVNTFWLSNPRRLVIDLPATKSPYEANSYDVAHPLIKQLRIGVYPEKIRYVVDTAEGVALESELGSTQGSRWIEVRRLSEDSALDKPEKSDTGDKQAAANLQADPEAEPAVQK